MEFELKLTGTNTVIKAQNETDLVEVQRRLTFANSIIDSKELTFYEIYALENTVANKSYIGQSISHRLNNGRYRPYGSKKRWDSHVSQALCNSESKPCQDIHVAIRTNKDDIKVHTLAYCMPQESDYWEQYFIRKWNTYHPFGYNLTTGGRSFFTGVKRANERVIPNNQKVHDKRKVGQTIHKEETKAKIAVGLRTYLQNNEAAVENITKRTRSQHMQKKIDVGNKFVINASDLNSYVVEHKRAFAVVFERKRDGKKVDFHVGKTETRDECRQRAIDFLNELVKLQQTHTPLNLAIQQEKVIN
jgi:hypothetical protein